MIERIEGIVTDIVKHNDKHNVVTLFTRQRGRMAFLAPVGKSKSGKMRNATLSLMAVVGADVNIRAGKELYNLSRVEPVRLWHSIYANPVKSSLLFFMAEFCSRLVRQYPADENLWNFLTGALERLEALPTSCIANFNLAFLVRLLPILGIEPSAWIWERGDRFDMLSGEMTAPDFHSNPNNLLPEEESRHVPKLLRINFDNMRWFHFSRAERNHTLSRLLDYYSVHLPIGRDYKSLPVLQSLFS